MSVFQKINKKIPIRKKEKIYIYISIHNKSAETQTPTIKLTPKQLKIQSLNKNNNKFAKKIKNLTHNARGKEKFNLIFLFCLSHHTQINHCLLSKIERLPTSQNKKQTKEKEEKKMNFFWFFR